MINNWLYIQTNGFFLCGLNKAIQNNTVLCDSGTYQNPQMPAKSCKRVWQVVTLFFPNFMVYINCTPRNHQGTFSTGKIRRINKFVAFWCVFLTTMKVDPESW